MCIRDRVFGERSRATTDGTTSSSDDEFPDPGFFPDVSNLLGNLNMGDNTDSAATAANAAAAAAANTGPYVLPPFLFQIFIKFLVLLFGVDVIGLSCLDAICSSTLLVCMFSSLAVYVVMIYQLSIRIKSYGNLLIYSTPWIFANLKSCLLQLSATVRA